MVSSPLLELSQISKCFPNVLANDDISFSIEHGEIHALLGENGAGKSTLVKIIYGILQPDKGSMILRGTAYLPKTPFEAKKNGIGMVFQHFSLFESLSVAENILLGLNQSLDRGKLNQKILQISEKYGLPIEPKKRISELSGGERQRVEIVRCLLQKPKLLIMDEPTSVLTPQEAEVLFSTLKKLSSDGCSVLYISHKLAEIRSLCSKATILRNGKVAAHCDPEEKTIGGLAKLMIGSNFKKPVPRKPVFGPKLLTVTNLSTNSIKPLAINLKNISFKVHSGEILGIAGVAGNGQSELFEVLSGERLAEKNSILLDCSPIGEFGPTERRKLGLCSIPEERLGHAIVPNMSLWQNSILSARTRKKLEYQNFIDKRASEKFSSEIIDTFKVKAVSVKSSAGYLSGGNLQKFVVGREILQDPKVLVILQPTWGVDASAAAQIHLALQELARKGTAVLAISQDLDELITIANNFSVISAGRLSKSRPTDNMTAEKIGLLMGQSKFEAKIGNKNDSP